MLHSSGKEWGRKMTTGEWLRMNEWIKEIWLWQILIVVDICIFKTEAKFNLSGEFTCLLKTMIWV